MGVRRTFRQINRLLSEYGTPGATDPGDPILRRTLIKSGSGGSGSTGGSAGGLDYPDLRTQRHGSIIASSIGATTGTQNFVSSGFVPTTGLLFDGSAAANVVSADPSVATVPGWNEGHGVFVNHTTTAATGNVAGHRSIIGIWRYRHGPRMRVVWRAGVDQAVSIDNCRIWIGTFSTLPTTTDNPVGHVAGFRWSTATGGAGDTVFRVLTKDGTTLRNTASGVPHMLGRVYLFEIDMRSRSEIIYKIDENIVDVATANLPDDNTDLQWVFRVVNGNGGAGATIRLGSFLWSSN